MGNFIDLTDKTFGFLHVTEQLPDKIAKSGRHRKLWACDCLNCGGKTSVTTDALKSGQQVSCGCYRIEKHKRQFTKHGKTNSRLYNVWSGIKSRCSNPAVETYPLYGGRGITVCEQWKKDFGAFYDWAMSHGYDENAPRGECTIDRIDVNGNYCPENCRIITQQEQGSNRRNNRFIEFNGLRLTVSEWARRTGIPREKITHRIVQLGWTPERALTTK